MSASPSQTGPERFWLLAFGLVDRHAGCRGGKQKPASRLTPLTYSRRARDSNPRPRGWFPRQRFSRPTINQDPTWTDALTPKLEVMHESRVTNPGPLLWATGEAGGH